MKKTFFGHILFLIVVNLLVKPFYLFGIDREVQNTLPAGDYGLFATLFGFTFLFQIVNDFGIQGYNNRRIAQHGHLLAKYFGDFLVLKGVLGLAYVLVVAIAGVVTGYLQAYPFLLGGILSNHFLTSLLLFLRSNVSGLALYRTDSILSITDRLLLILLLGLILYVPGWRTHLRLEWFVLAQTIALSATCVFALGILLPRVKRIRWRFRPALLLVILRQSYPYALVVFLMTLYTRIDSVMIEQLLPEGLLEVDRYASAYRLLDASNMIGYLFATLLLPMFSRQLRAGESPGELAHFSARILLSGALTLAAGVVMVRTPLMEALYTEGNAYSGLILAWLMVSFVGVCGTYVYGTLLTAAGDLMPLNRIFGVSVIANVAVNALLIPQYGALGAALATCLTQLGVFLAQLWLAYRSLDLQAKPGTIVQLGVLALGLIAGGWAIPQWFPGIWYGQLLAELALGGVLAILLGLIDIRSALQLLSSNTGEH